LAPLQQFLSATVTLSGNRESPSGLLIYELFEKLARLSLYLITDKMVR